MEFPKMEPAAPTPERSKNAPSIPTYNVGDIIDFSGKPVKIKGFTAQEGDPGRAFMTQALSQEELEAYTRRKEVINGKIKTMIEANPNAIIDIEQAKKFWGRLYDETLIGGQAEMQIHEIYAQRYESYVKAAQQRMLVFENQLNKVKNEAEKQALFAQIAEERAAIKEYTAEATKRRNYTKN